MAASLLACDWGTTNLRAWTLDSEGAVVAHREFELGVSRLAAGEAARRFQAEVRPALQAEELPAMLCGMVGSNLGWTVAPYADCPAGLAELAAGLTTVEAAGAPVRIVPGLRCEGLAGSPDVMRGEETQLLGWVAQHPDRSRGRQVVCHPGTHAKWVLIEGGRIVRFVTAMTGELFAVLSRHSVLKGEGPSDDEAAFDEGLAAAGEGDALAARLFTARARVVGGGRAAESTPSYLSGLLIGAEVAAVPRLLGPERDQPVALLGDSALCGRYAHAFARRGIRSETFDGEAAALAGLFALDQMGSAPMTLDEALTQCPVVAIVRGIRPDEVVDHAQALYEAGVRGVEAPLNSPDPIESIRRLSEAFGDRMAIGAGTVLQADRVDEVARAGGRIIVSPNTQPEVIRRAVSLGLDPAPGFATATEAFTALAAGARHLKLFPAVTYGPAHLKQLKAVLPPEAVVWAVGGVGAEDMSAWWAAGARAFGLGGELYRAGQSVAETAEKARRVVAAIGNLD